MSKQHHLIFFNAHAGDGEYTAGGVAALYATRGHKVTFVHLTLGEKGNPTLSAVEYAQRKREASQAAARVLKADTLFLPYQDGELPASEEVRMRVCDTIRELRPDIIITHWKGSFHKDHINAHQVVMEGAFYAALPGVERELPAHKVTNVYFTENWEDRDGFRIDLSVNITDGYDLWMEALTAFEAERRPLVSFPYKDYYAALARIRGAEAGVTYAQSFMLPKISRTRCVPEFPEDEPAIIF